MSTIISVPPQQLLERILTLEIVRVTERAAVSAARLRGHGNEKGADQAAVDAMRRELNKMPIEGTIVIGEGERDEAPMLYIGEKVGINAGPKWTSPSIPLEGTTLCAKNMPGSIATMAMADGGTLLHAPDVYMQKIAIGPGFAKNVIDIDATPDETFAASPKPRTFIPLAITALVLDRPRHAPIIAAIRSTRGRRAPDRRRRRRRRDPLRRSREVRRRHLHRHRRRARRRAGSSGAALHRRPDADPADSRHRRKTRARAQDGHHRSKFIYGIEDMARGDCLFAATGVTDGSLLSGVKFRKHVIETETIVMRSVTGTVRIIKGEHRQFEKFHLD